MFPQWEFLSRSHSCANNLSTRAAAVEERLGSGSEADRFRVDVEHGSLVKGIATRKALHCGDQPSELDRRTSVYGLLRTLSIFTQRLDWSA